MKKLAYKFLIALTIGGTASGLQSCGDWLDINTNEYAATEVDPGYLFTNAALNYSMKRCGADQFLTLMYAAQTASEQTQWFNYIFGGEPYGIDAEYSSGNAWVGTYSSTGYNLQRAIGFAQEKGHVNAEAQCKILTANVFWETTMLFGDIPYSEAWHIDEIKEPKFDTQKEVLYALEELLDEALDQVFGGDSGASAGDAENVGDTTDDKQDAKNDDSADGKTNTDGKQDTPSNTDGKTGGNNGDSSGTMSADLKKALADAAQAMKDSDAAMKKGDWSAYGDAQKQLQEALNKAIELEQ